MSVVFAENARNGAIVSLDGLKELIDGLAWIK